MIVQLVGALDCIPFDNIFGVGSHDPSFGHNHYSNSKMFLMRINVPTHVVTLTQVGTSVYLGQTHLGTPFQVPAWVRKFSFGSTGDEISSLIIIQSLFVQQNFEY